MSDGWKPYLQEGEKLLWEGRPDTRTFLFDRQEKFKYALAFGWVLFMLYFVDSTTDEPIMRILGNFLSEIPTLLLVTIIIIFGYFIVGRWFLDAYERRNTVYALSDRRVFIAHSAYGKQDMRDMAITPDMAVKFKNEPLGIITFGPKPNIFIRNNKWVVDDGSFTFRGLSDAVHVLELLAKVQEEMEES